MTAILCRLLAAGNSVLFQFDDGKVQFSIENSHGVLSGACRPDELDAEFTSFVETYCE